MISLPPGLAILNCAAGDIRVAFDKGDPQEVARAERIVADMLSRGYIIFAYDEEGKLHRVESFDATTCEYVIADGPQHGKKQAAKTGTPKKAKESSEKDPPRKRLPADKSPAVGVARTAGG